MVKRYTQTSGALVETFDTFDGRPIGQWVKHEDYESLQAALREALEEWEDRASATQFCDNPPWEKRIAALRKEFLDV